MKLKDKFMKKISKSESVQRLGKYKESFDVLWSNTRARAGIKLSIWFVLILILSLCVHFFGSTDSVETTEVHFENTSVGVKKYFSNINSYQANVSLYKGDIVSSYLFTCNGKCIINHDGSKYYYDGEVYSIIDGVKTMFDDVELNRLIKFNVSNISNLVSNVDEDYFTVFKDGSYSVLYSVLGSDFFIDFDFSSYISVKFTGNNDVNSVVFDFTNLQSDDFYDKVVIDYSNINSIDSVEDL